MAASCCCGLFALKEGEDGRKAEATPGVTDTADDLRWAVAASAARVLVAEVEGRLVESIIGTFDGWRGDLYRLSSHPDCQRRGVGRALVTGIGVHPRPVSCMLRLVLNHQGQLVSFEEAIRQENAQWTRC